MHERTDSDPGKVDLLKQKKKKRIKSFSMTSLLLCWNRIKSHCFWIAPWLNPGDEQEEQHIWKGILLYI